MHCWKSLFLIFQYFSKNLLYPSSCNCSPSRDLYFSTHTQLFWALQKTYHSQYHHTCEFSLSNTSEFSQELLWPKYNAYWFWFPLLKQTLIEIVIRTDLKLTHRIDYSPHQYKSLSCYCSLRTWNHWLQTFLNRLNLPSLCHLYCELNDKPRIGFLWY